MNIHNIRRIHNPDESNPLLMPELVSVILWVAGMSVVISAFLGVIQWLA